MAAINTWSTTAASNNAAVPDGAPEGWFPSDVNAWGRETMAAVRTQWNDAAWFLYGDGDGSATIAYASATTFTVASTDVTAVYHVGRRIRAVGSTTGTIYGTITGSTFSTNTTVTVLWDSGSLQNEALTISLSIIPAAQNVLPGQVGRNIFRNGAMAIAQRGSTASVASGYGAVDGWEMNSLSGAPARYTLSQESSGGVGGNAKWAKILVTTADGSPAGADAHYFGQKIEGFDAQALLDDSGDLLASTMSFDIIVHADGASSLSFPITCAICVNDNGFANQQYVKTFTVAAADTWERVSVAIAANAAAVIDNDNSNQLQVSLTIYAGSAKETTDATWESASGSDVSVSGVDNLADATNNYVGLTNVQLEVGSVATDFEHEDIGTTLAKSLRYFERIGGDGSIVTRWSAGGVRSTTVADAWVRYAEKRASPTITISAADDVAFIAKASGFQSTSVSFDQAGIRSARAIVTVSGGGLTAGDGAVFYFNAAADYIDVSAEL